MFKAIFPSRHHCKRRRPLDQRSQAARREAFQRGLRYETLEDRCLLSAGQSGSIGDKVVTIAATDNAAGDVTGGTGTFEISRSGSTSNPLTVNLYASGSAKPGLDYVLAGGAATTLDDQGDIQVTIAAGSRFVDVTLTALGGSQSTEKAILAVMNGTGYDVGTPDSATVNMTISHPNTTTPLVSVAASTSPAAEPSTNSQYTITRTGGDQTLPQLTVNFAMSGTATRGSDYNLVVDGTTLPTGTNSLTFSAGQSSPIVVTLAVLDDTTVEQTENAVLTVQSGTGYIVGSGYRATVQIADDDAVSVSVAATDPNAGEPSTNGQYTITRSGGGATGLNSPLTVNFTMSGSGTRGTDYYIEKADTTVVTGNSVVLSAGQTSMLLTLAVIDDTVSEPTETATLTVQPNGSAYNVGAPASADITLTDDDPILVTVSAPDSSASETVTGQPSDGGTYRITRTGDTTSALAISFAMGGDAAQGTDYNLVVNGTTLTGNTVTIAAGTVNLIYVKSIDATSPLLVSQMKLK